MVLIMAAPWLIRNWIWLGNPLSPFLNRVFPNPYIHIVFEDEYRRFFRSYDLPSLKPLFWMVTVKGQLGGQLWACIPPDTVGIAEPAQTGRPASSIGGFVFSVALSAKSGSSFSDSVFAVCRPGYRNSAGVFTHRAGCFGGGSRIPRVAEEHRKIQRTGWWVADLHTPWKWRWNHSPGSVGRWNMMEAGSPRACWINTYRGASAFWSTTPVAESYTRSEGAGESLFGPRGVDSGYSYDTGVRAESTAAEPALTVFGPARAQSIRIWLKMPIIQRLYGASEKCGFSSAMKRFAR